MMSTRSKINFLFIILLGLITIIFCLTKGQRNIFNYDGGIYYSYLPEFFISNGIGFDFPSTPDSAAQGHVETGTTESGAYVPKMTGGVALLILPFFLIAHFIALIFGLNADGFSFPYILALYVSGFFYFLIGIYVLRRQLLEYYSEKISDLVILILSLGTNLFYYSTSEPTLSHNYLFFLFTLFLVFTIKVNKNPTLKNYALLGTILGIITLIRPSNLIILSFFLMFGVINTESFRSKLFHIGKNIKIILVGILFFVAVISLQLVYWKLKTGKIFVDTYSVEHFFFDNPHILSGLFSFRKGWFIYTPVMLLIVPGIYFLIKSRSAFGKAILIYLILTVYIIYSWWCWWYGASFSCRAIVESYALLSFPIAEAFYRLKGKLDKIILYIFIPLCIILNLFQTYQYMEGAIHYESMTWEAYRLSFGKIKNDYRFNEALKIPDTEYAAMGMDERRGAMKEFPYLKEVLRKKVYIIASNGKYICADFSNGSFLFANRDEPGGWETFEFILYDYDRCILRAGDRNYVSSDLNNAHILTANRPSASIWELFTYISLGDDHFALKDCQGNFIQCDSMDGKLRGATPNFSVSQVFTFKDAGN